MLLERKFTKKTNKDYPVRKNQKTPTMILRSILLLLWPLKI